MNIREDDGFTLVELLITIVILGTIIAAIGNAIIVGLKVTDETTDRLSESHDAQIASAYMVSDVQSSVTVTVTSGAHGACGQTNSVVNFEWKDYLTTTTAVDKVASYVTETVGDETRLTRQVCEGSSYATRTSTIPVVHLLSSSTGPQLSCTPSCSGGPSVVTMTVTDRSGYRYSLSGRRRAT